MELFANIFNLAILLFLKHISVLSTDKNLEYLTFNIEHPKELFNMPLAVNDRIYQLTFNSAVYGIHIAHERSDQIQPDCCWRVCVQNFYCIDTCTESKSETNITLTGYMLNITSKLNNNLHYSNCRGSIRIQVLSYYCDIQTVETDGRKGNLYKPGEEAYVKCDHFTEGVGCNAVTCQSNGSWSSHNGCHLHHDLSGRCSIDTSTETASEIPPPSTLLSSLGTFATTSMPSSTSSSHQDQRITGSIPLLLSSFSSFSVFGDMSTRVDVSNMLFAGRNFSTSILPSSIYLSSSKEISASPKLLPNSSHPLESKMILIGEHTTAVLSNENKMKTIRPTRSSFYQSEIFSHTTNGSDLIYSLITPSVYGFNSSYITKVPVLHTDYNMDSVDTKDKPDSKVALGIVIGVFVIIVAVLLAMIFRSAMETKVEDMPRATNPAENSEKESHSGIQIDAIDVGNPLFLNINGDFSESTTDDDVSCKSDVSLKSKSDMSVPRNQSQPSINGGSRQNTSRETNTHHTTFSNDTSCFKAARPGKTKAIKDNFSPAHNVDGDIYAVSYKQKKAGRR